MKQNEASPHSASSPQVSLAPRLGPMDPSDLRYPHVARRRPGRVKIRAQLPLPEFHLSEFDFSLGRLSSDELALNLDVFLGRKGPPYQTRRGFFFPSFVRSCLLLISIVKFVWIFHLPQPVHILINKYINIYKYI